MKRVRKAGELFFCFDFGDGQFPFSIDLFQDAGRGHFLGTVADVFVESFGLVIIGQVIRDRLAILAFGLNDRLALVGCVQSAFGAFGFAFDGDFFVLGEGRCSEAQQNQAGNGQE